MPVTRKKMYKKKRTTKKRGRNVPRPLVYPFRRVDQYNLDMGSPSEGWITTVDNCIVKTISFTLNQLTNYTEFVNLFESYKLNYGVIKIYPTTTGNDVLVSSGGTNQVNNLISVWANTHGQSLDATFTIDDLNQIQKKKQWLMPSRNPTVIKMPLKQLSLRYGPTTIPPSTVDYASQKPRYISTSEPSTLHYGVNIHIQNTTGNGFLSSYNNFLLIQQQVLLTCKQVK